MSLVKFFKDGTFEFPKNWARKKKKRISRKIRKKQKQGFIF
jgi:hypothetical protein